MAVLQPSGITGWNQQDWEFKFERATYQKMKMIPTIDDHKRPLGVLNIMKKARVSAATLIQSSEGTGLTPSTIIDTAVTITPAGNYVAVYWSENLEAQIPQNIDAESASDIEAALAESSEQSVLANAQSLTKILSQADVDASMLRRGIGRLFGNSNGVIEPGAGGKEQIYGVFTNKQYPNLVNIPEVNAADVRGDSENPYIKGIWVKGFGFTLMLSTVVANDANGDHNVLYIPEAFGIGWNVRSRIKRMDEELQNQLIAYNNFGSCVKHNDRAMALRTTANAL